LAYYGREKMRKSSFIGRIEEISLLEEYYNSSKSELVAVYGRRRVGKTYLICETLGDRFDFEYTGKHKIAAKVQIGEFQKELNRLTKDKNGKASDWFEAFDNLKEYLLKLKKDRVVVFIDELPWMDTSKSNFLAALSSFWNGWRSKKTLLKLYVCGSATTWMVDKFIGDKGGLYGRVSRPIYLAPFTLLETEQYLNEIKKMKYGRKLVLDTYMIFGGIPYYLDMLNNKKPLSENVDNLFFANNAPLKTEFDFIFRSLFKDSINYRRVIEYLSTKLIGQTREDISDKCKLTGGELSKILNNLVSCDFIRCYMSPRKKERSKMYQLTDMFSLFYLRFVNKNAGIDEHFWTNIGKTGKKNAWSGYAFEQVCLNHIPQIKAKLGISGILSNSYAWSKKAFTDSNGNEWEGGQIDLIIDRNDDIMNLCEMKYSSNELFSISPKYAKDVRDRMAMFRASEKTRKDLRCTFVTVYGVKQNPNSDIVVDQVILDDLFT
jgi:AAA+ ATPase superfamily predicted ATPase